MFEVSSTKIIFDGKSEAQRIADELKRSGALVDKKLVIIQCDGSTNESVYVALKRKMGESLGAAVEVVIVENKEQLAVEIDRANRDILVQGILVQLPVIGAGREEIDQILSSIDIGKDVDGLNPKSSFIPAVVMAVETVIEKINLEKDKSIGLVGSEGAVGRRLYERLTELGFVVSGFEKGDDLSLLSEFDVVIGSTGVASVIEPSMVKKGFVGIDLGYPKSDFSPEAIEKAAVITPVPGGVGPLTIVSLFVNLAQN